MVSVDTAKPDKVVPVVVADAIVATLYPVVDVVEDPCTVEYPSKKNKSYLAHPSIRAFRC